MAVEKKKAAAGTSPTEYYVLKAVVDAASKEGCWQIVQLVNATSAPSAIRACVSKLAPSDQAGTFVAVPARSWKPTKVAPQTQIRLELTEVS